MTLVSLLLFSSEDPHRFDDPLEISNLLYMTQENSKHSEPIKRIRTALEGGEVKKLQGYFADCVVIWLKAAVLLLLAWYITFQWKCRLFAVAPFAIIFGINTVLLPMLYGVLQKVIRFPVITLISSSELLTKSPSKFFLLNKTDAEFVIWDAAGKTVVWIPMGEVKAAAISQVELLFKSSTKERPSEKLGDVHGIR